MIQARAVVPLCSVAVALAFAVSNPAARELSFEDRVAAQRAIEAVYWSHRDWPKDNPTPKPALAQVMSDEMLRAKVDDYLRKSNAVETWWRRPITHGQLQAELDRMARDSRDPQALSELFSALGNDPFVIAETLARQTLADRLIRSWYAADARFQVEGRAAAEAALKSCAGVDCMKTLGGDYRQVTLALRDADRAPLATGGDVVELDAEEWTEQVAAWASRLHASGDAIPLRRLSGLIEKDDTFFVSAVLARQATAITIASVAWPKQPFDGWWKVESMRQSGRISPDPEGFDRPVITAPQCTNDTWRPTFQGSSEKRRYHTVVWTGTEMIVWGGETTGGSGIPLFTGARYNPATDSWKPTSLVNPPQARTDHSAVWTGSEMIIWGGLASGSPTSLGSRYNPTTDAWTNLSGSAPQARRYHTAVWTGTEMIVWGGFTGSSYLDTGGRYNPVSNSWTATAVNPSGRYRHTAIWTGSEMIVWGGSSGGYLDTGGRYSPSTDTWIATSTAGPSGRFLHSAVWTGTEMIVWGGFNGAAENTGGRYEPSTNSWSATPTGAGVPSARSGHGAVWTGNEMLVWGGSNGPTKTNSGGRYDPAAGTWNATSVGASVPSPRVGFTAVWSGNEMIVFGGNDSSEFAVNSGSRYNPTSDSWVPISTGGSPEGRIRHSALWTGTEMIVWGGFSSSALNTGGRYDPALDAWTSTALGANVPTARSDHTAVWTGTEMIVWGGVNTGSYLGTGGRYNPASDSWISTPAGPTARVYHTAVWTGTEMIVWGGTTAGGAATNTGSRYDPVAESWAATSAGPAPGRGGHTAVWTGHEMIVWGGANGGFYTDTGGCYNPVSNSWISTPAGPTARAGHTAVWTGNEMIIWGGYSVSQPFPATFYNTGGRYDPAGNSWQPTSTGAGVPSSRASHSATWTGTEMIVWGGEFVVGTQLVYLNTGGRYNVGTNSWTATSTVGGPVARRHHEAVWTKSEMIVWGGEPLTPAGGRYCSCPTMRTVYRDADGDGFGDPSAPASSLCDGTAPGGYVIDGTDCNDGSASVYPNAPEVNDGLDNQCGGDAGFGVIDEISGVGGFLTADSTRLSWPPQSGATEYEVVRSTTRDFASGCTSFQSTDSFIVDAQLPGPAGVFYYLVRATTPHAGSWGQNSDGSERVVVCAGP